MERPPGIATAKHALKPPLVLSLAPRSALLPYDHSIRHLPHLSQALHQDIELRVIATSGSRSFGSVNAFTFRLIGTSDSIDYTQLIIHRQACAVLCTRAY